MTCSVVMVSYRTGPVLFAAIKAALAQKQLAELVVVDNGNPPVALTRLQQMALTEPRLIILTGHGNIGFAAGCNLGAARATGEYLLFLNPDCLLPPHALTDTVSAFKQMPDAVLAGCRLENPDGSEQPRSRLPKPVNAIRELRELRFNRSNKNPMLSLDEPFEVSAISSAFMFIRRDDYNHLHGFDEGFFLRAENFDLCMRVHKEGGKVICVPPVRVTRMAGHRAASLSFLEWQEAKGLQRYFDKHFQGKHLPGFLTLVHAAIFLRFAFRLAMLELKTHLRPKSTDLASRRLMILAAGLAELPESAKMTGKTVLLTGATGQVGLCVMRRLLAAGSTVCALSRSDGIPFRHERLRWIRGDLSDKSLRLNDCRADAVVHCVPLWHLPAMNTLAETGAKRVIVFSSTSIFAKALSKNEFEKSTARNLAQGETALTSGCRENGMALTILRPTLIYGIGLDANISTLVKFIRRFGFFPVYPPAFGRRQPVHADDLAIAALNVMDNEVTYGKAYNVSGGEIITYRDMLERLFRLLGKPPRILATTLLPSTFDMIGWLLGRKTINGEIARRMNDDLIFFHDEAARDFHFAPRPFLSGGMRDIDGF